MSQENTDTAICTECGNYVPVQKIIAWKLPQENRGVCWECYGDEA